MEAKNYFLEDKSLDDLVRENEILWELAQFEIKMKRLSKQLDYHKSFNDAEGFRKVLMNQIEREIDRIRDGIDSIIDRLEH